jgi:hypothetical protein
MPKQNHRPCLDCAVYGLDCHRIADIRRSIQVQAEWKIAEKQIAKVSSVYKPTGKISREIWWD